MYDMFAALLALGGFALDQWLKAYVTANIPLGRSQPLVPGLVELRTVHNYGAAWSSFSCLLQKLQKAHLVLHFSN